MNSKEITIKFEIAVHGHFAQKLLQRYPETDDLFLTANDEQRLLTESKKNIIVASVEDSATLDPQLSENINTMLENLLIESRGRIKFYHDFSVGDSLFLERRGLSTR